MRHTNPVTEQEKERIREYKRENPNLFLRDIAEIFGRSMSTISDAIRGTERSHKKSGPKDAYHTGMKSRPIPPWKAPKTGSDSGFIRPLNYDLLVSGRAR